MMGGVGYLSNIFVGAIPPIIQVRLFPYIMLPAGIAEISLTLWLMIVGVNVAKWDVMAKNSRVILLQGEPRY